MPSDKSTLKYYSSDDGTIYYSSLGEVAVSIGSSAVMDTAEVLSSLQAGEGFYIRKTTDNYFDLSSDGSDD